MGIEDALSGVVSARADIDRANEKEKISLLNLRRYFAGSIDAFNRDAGNEYIIVGWNASAASGSSTIIINIELLKNRETGDWLNEESYSSEDFKATKEELKRIIKKETNQDIEVSISSSYFGK